MAGMSTYALPLAEYRSRENGEVKGWMHELRHFGHPDISYRLRYFPTLPTTALYSSLVLLIVILAYRYNIASRSIASTDPACVMVMMVQG